MERRQYRNPPIEEAVCELRFSANSEAEFTAPARFYERIKTSYPGKPRYQQFMAAGIQVPPHAQGAQMALRQEGVKILFPSQDNLHLVGLTLNQLSIHGLRPYLGWSDFRSRIEKALLAYRESASPTGITRIAVRYINRLQVQSPNAVASDYITACARMPSESPTQLVNFVTRLESVYEDQPIQLKVVIATAEPPSAEVSAWLLDIDVAHEWTADPLPLASAMERIDDLRTRERDAFESLITNSSREVFDAK